MTGRRLAPGKRRHELLFERRMSARHIPECGRNIRTDEGWDICKEPRMMLAGERMGCCQSCFERTRPVMPINLERKRHYESEGKT